MPLACCAVLCPGAAQETRPAEEVEAEARRSEAVHRAVVLEMVGDLPDAGESSHKALESSRRNSQFIVVMVVCVRSGGA